MTVMDEDPVDGRPTGDLPFDRIGLACLAWTGAFLALTLALSFVLR
jgi:hypothetical protein